MKRTITPRTLPPLIARTNQIADNGKLWTDSDINTSADRTALAGAALDT